MSWESVSAIENSAAMVRRQAKQIRKSVTDRVFKVQAATARAFEARAVDPAEVLLAVES